MRPLKFYLESADASGYRDGVTAGQLFNRLNTTNVLSQADVVLVRTVCQGEPFKFNHHLNRLLTAGKPIVFVDYLEHGWDYDFSKGNVMGEHMACIPCTEGNNPEWGTLHGWIQQASPILHFKRELRTQDVRDDLIPIDFLAEGPSFPVDSLEQYSSRPYDVTFVWGYSNAVRPRLHGKIVEAMGTKSIDVITSFEQIPGRPGNANHHRVTPLWVAIHQAHWVRKPMAEVYALGRKGRLVVSLPGAGVKTFRDSEAPNGSLPVFLQDDLARSYPWEHMVNCFKLRVGQEFEDLYEMTFADPKFMHQIYLNAQTNLDRYRPEAYIKNYFIPSIESHL